MSGIGHIGELQVIEEFQNKHKIEVYLPMTDKGIDFIGVHNNSSVQVQVKTSKFHNSKYYWMDLYKNKMIYSENTFYVFVLYVLPRRKMMGKSKNFLVIPSLDLKEYIENKSIVSKKNDDNCLNIRIYPFLDEKIVHEDNNNIKDVMVIEETPEMVLFLTLCNPAGVKT